jgi:hypothetical protein
MLKRGEPGWIAEHQENHKLALRRLSLFLGPGSHRPPETCMTPEEMCGLLEAASAAPIGSFVEVGVYKGGSAFFLSKLAQGQNRSIFLYDTFEGMPYCDPSIDTIPLGHVHGPNDTSLEAVRAAVGDYPYIEKGTFPFVKRLPPAGVAFAHIDVDQYQSHIETCRALEPLMAPGGIMYFDDVPVLESARKAVRELYGDRVQAAACGRWLVRF